jgi:ornithine cyclodeaminase
VFDSVGFALEDYSALRYLDGLARQHNAGVEISLIPPATDPKNLFALIGASQEKASEPALGAADVLAFAR